MSVSLSLSISCAFRTALEHKVNICVQQNVPHCDKTNKMACAPSEDSDQPGHLPSLIRVFAVRLKKARSLSYPLSVQRRLWSDWADAQADQSLRWAHVPFCWFCHDAAQICLNPREVCLTADRSKAVVLILSELCMVLRWQATILC